MIEIDEVYGPDGELREQRQRVVTAEELTDRRRRETGQPLTTEQYAAVRAQMQVLRGLRQQGRAAFMALTAAERDRLTYDALVAVTEILLTVLRDEP